MEKEQLKLALIQATLQWENPKANLLSFEEMLQQVSQDADLIILPEMFSTGFTMTPQNLSSAEGEYALTWMQKQAAQYNAMILGSLVWPLGEGQFTNRLFAVTPSGEFQYYDKRHCFTLAGEDEVYQAGNKHLILEWRGFKICPLICYDLRFPVWSRNTFYYDLLVYVANWPAPRINAWDALLKARAIENMAYCAGVNRVGKDENNHQYPGHSSLFDPLGKSLVYLEEKSGVIEAVIRKKEVVENRSKLRFLEDRDRFEIL